jgi:hypothetical protein
VPAVGAVECRPSYYLLPVVLPSKVDGSLVKGLGRVFFIFPFFFYVDGVSFFFLTTISN